MILENVEVSQLDNSFNGADTVEYIESVLRGVDEAHSRADEGGADQDHSLHELLRQCNGILEQYSVMLERLTDVQSGFGLPTVQVRSKKRKAHYICCAMLFLAFNECNLLMDYNLSQQGTSPCHEMASLWAKKIDEFGQMDRCLSYCCTEDEDGLPDLAPGCALFAPASCFCRYAGGFVWAGYNEQTACALRQAGVLAGTRGKDLPKKSSPMNLDTVVRQYDFLSTCFEILFLGSPTSCSTIGRFS